jgi:hypothetical protein
MPAGVPGTSIRFLTWVCVALLAILSLLPAQDMVRTGLPGELEHFAAYAGSGAIAMAGYGLERGPMRVLVAIRRNTRVRTCRISLQAGTRQ